MRLVAFLMAGVCNLHYCEDAVLAKKMVRVAIGSVIALAVLGAAVWVITFASGGAV